VRRPVARRARISHKDGASLPCSFVREANLHGEGHGSAASRGQSPGEVWRKGKRAKGPALTSLVSTGACWGAHLRKGGASTQARVNENAPASGPRRRARAVVAQRRLKGTRKARQTTRARRCRRRHLQGKHPSLARWPASPAAAERCEWRVPPRLEGRGVLRGAGEACSHLGGHGP
jgi:hypothetical protein